MKAFLQRFNFFLTTLYCIAALLPVALNMQTSGYSPLQPEEIRLNAVLIADTHTDGDVIRDRNNVLRRSFGAVACSKTPLDALVIAGDITNFGGEVEYQNLNNMLKYLDKSKQLIPQMGNHDTGTFNNFVTFEEDSRFFQDFCKEHGIETEKNYYCKTVNDYYFIVLGTEEQLQNEAYISDTQLEWLDETLTSAQNNGKIAFIICHQPLNDTNGVADIWAVGGLGEQSSQVQQIIKNHTDSGMTVLFVSGHLHATVCSSNFEMISKGFYCLNLPSFLFMDGGGYGVHMEVYDDMVLLRMRNFINHNEEARYVIPLAETI